MPAKGKRPVKPGSSGAGYNDVRGQVREGRFIGGHRAPGVVAKAAAQERARLRKARADERTMREVAQATGRASSLRGRSDGSS